MESENRAKIYVAETKVVSLHHAGRVAKKKGEKYEIEAGMLLKTHVEKMSSFGLTIMLLKTK